MDISLDEHGILEFEYRDYNKEVWQRFSIKLDKRDRDKLKQELEDFCE